MSEIDFVLDEVRTRWAAINITRVLEGGGFGSVSRHHKTGLRYGIAGFNLTEHTLSALLYTYLKESHTVTAKRLQDIYLPDLLHSHEQRWMLRMDDRLRQLLRAAANEPWMRRTQVDCAVAFFWDFMQMHYSQPRGGLHLPLSYALLYDITVCLVQDPPYIHWAHTELGLTEQTPLSLDMEKMLMRYLALEIYIPYCKKQYQSHQSRSEHNRAMFWQQCFDAEDWLLQGNADGMVDIAGRQLQIQRPWNLLAL